MLYSLNINELDFTLQGRDLAAEVDQEDGDVGRGDAGDVGGLGDGGGLVALEFLAAFDGEALDAVEIEVGGNLDVFEAFVLFCLKALPLDVAGVFDCDFHSLHYFARKCSTWNNSQQVFQREFRTRNEFRKMFAL